MAIVFELYVECLKKTDAEQIASHFSNLKFELLSGNIASVAVTQQLGLNGEFGVVIFPNVGSHYGIESLQDALECTEASLHLYKHLQIGPDFDFAHVGLEAETTSIADLPHHIHSINSQNNHISVWMNFQCVLSNHLYEKLQRPKYFREFRPDYMWNQYRGESYKPLLSPDQKDLNDRYKQLFPEVFDSHDSKGIG